MQNFLQCVFFFCSIKQKIENSSSKLLSNNYVQHIITDFYRAPLVSEWMKVITFYQIPAAWGQGQLWSITALQFEHIREKIIISFLKLLIITEIRKKNALISHKRNQSCLAVNCLLFIFLKSIFIFFLRNNKLNVHTVFYQNTILYGSFSLHMKDCLSLNYDLFNIREDIKVRKILSTHQISNNWSHNCCNLLPTFDTICIFGYGSIC